MTTTKRTIRIQQAGRSTSGIVTNTDTGETIPGVTGVDIEMRVGEIPRATLHVVKPTIDVETTDIVYRGLERVPTEALRAELERRGEGNPLVLNLETQIADERRANQMQHEAFTRRISELEQEIARRTRATRA